MRNFTKYFSVLRVMLSIKSSVSMNVNWRLRHNGKVLLQTCSTASAHRPHPMHSRHTDGGVKKLRHDGDYPVHHSMHKDNMDNTRDSEMHLTILSAAYRMRPDCCFHLCNTRKRVRYQVQLPPPCQPEGR